MQSPRWLVASVVGIVATTAVLSVSWLGICTWVIGPQLWNEYVKTEGKLPAQEPKVCENADERAIQVMTSLLATMLALMSNPPSAGDR